MPRILARYVNGNYRVLLYEDGTKIKRTEEDAFRADFPDSIDLKITDYCENACPMCHERSSRAGRHGNLAHSVIDTFPSGMEVAIGGGNPLSHPDLLPFLERLKQRRIIANLTVNVLDLRKERGLVKRLLRERLIYGLGVSCLTYDEFAVDFALSHPNAVLHLICGVFPLEALRRMMGKPIKILLLGYKKVGKGREYFSSDVEKRLRETKAALADILSGFKVISFDNAALEQLDIRGAIGEKRFSEIFMGADGDASMYVDLVREEYALSSSTTERFHLTGDLQDCFRHLSKPIQ